MPGQGDERFDKRVPDLAAILGNDGLSTDQLADAASMFQQTLGGAACFFASLKLFECPSERREVRLRCREWQNFAAEKACDNSGGLAFLGAALCQAGVGLGAGCVGLFPHPLPPVLFRAAAETM